ncbi:MAG: hypothetical protein DRO15_02170 [Thermoprotei archaeon]|nr:MAG: hypothetical protein DRO15_02170 [Thermoprotei archaeon]
MKEYKLEELPDDIRDYVALSLKELEKRGINLQRIKLFLMNYIPMRLQEIMSSSFENLEILEALVVGNRLVLICTENEYESPFIAIYTKILERHET